MKKPGPFESLDGQFILFAGFRYCLGRHTYAPSLFVEWMKTHWELVPDKDRRQMLKEIIHHIVTEHSESSPLDSSLDMRTWQDFARWVKDNTKGEQGA